MEFKRETIKQESMKEYNQERYYEFLCLVLLIVNGK